MTRTGNPVWACVALGSNVGDREAHFLAAIEAIRGLPGTAVQRVSRFHETVPVGPTGQGMYLNAALSLTTELGAAELLRALHTIEASRGRDRPAEVRWGSRTLDLDLVLYGDLVIAEPGLRVPHPRMHERYFVLEPLAEIEENRMIPGRGVTVGQALAELRRDGSPPHA